MPELLDAAAPGLLVAQAIGRVGNWWNQELFGEPTSRPWGLEIDSVHRPDEFLFDETFHPTFLYEALWNLGAAGLLLVLDRRIRFRPPALFALYVALYTGFRFYLETLRVDPSEEIARHARELLGLRRPVRPLCGVLRLVAVRSAQAGGAVGAASPKQSNGRRWPFRAGASDPAASLGGG